MAATGAPQTGVARRPVHAVVVYSRSEVIVDGIVGLLPEDWRDRVAVASGLETLEPLLEPGTPVVVDGEIEDAAQAVPLARGRAGSVVLLLGSSPGPAPEVLDAADAILRRDDAGPVALRIAFAAGRIGMRVIPRSAPAPPGAGQGAAGVVLPESARRVLELLSQGMRDAEIALELNLSESAVRKLVQRTVRAVGARTRCQAVAIATRTGQLD
jgi:DNA-binding CsgD family transcriptional regulator